MPTLVQLKTKVNNWLTTWWPLLVARQETYLENNDCYFQGLKSHTNVPAHTDLKYNDAAPDNLGSAPTDKLHSWNDFLPELSGVATTAQVECHEYDGPKGRGYVVLLYMRYNSDIYIRAQNVGPETYRTRNWHKLELEDAQQFFTSK